MVHIDEAANIVRDAGGRLVGRTRFQKLAFLLEASGLGAGFSFEYRRFGPYSDELNICTRDAELLGLIQEEEIKTAWGGTYSIFRSEQGMREGVPITRLELARIATAADPVELELAATAVYLAMEGASNAWEEVCRRKPEKSERGRIEKAKSLYQRIRSVETPIPLPEM